MLGINTSLIQVFLLISLQLSLNAIVLGFTRPASNLRLGVLPLNIVCLFEILPKCLNASGTVLLAALLGAHSATFLVQYIDTALVTRWSVDADGYLRQHRQSQDQAGLGPAISRWPRFRLGLYIAVSTRMIGTPYQVVGVPPSSRQDPNYFPGKLTFLLQKLVVLVRCYLFLDLSSFLSQPEQNPQLFHPGTISWLDTQNLSFERLIIRCTSVLGFWTSLYCIIEAYMGLLGFLSVGSGLSDVKQWPPGFGSVTEAYTLRRFWGRFWHKYQQMKMSNIGTFFAENVLQIRKGTLTFKNIHLFSTFLISGLMHALTEIAQGLPPWESGAIRFFCTQAFGIMFEAAAQRSLRKVLRLRKSDDSQHTNFGRYLGYCWTTFFLIWSTPVWIYPTISQNSGEEKDRIIPFSVFEFMNKNLSW